MSSPPNGKPPPLSLVGAVLDRARSVAADYYRLTGRPLGITGEVGEYEAARLLRLKLAPPRSAGYDAFDPKTGRRFQIKARATIPHRPAGAQRLGSIKLKGEWHAVLLVLLDHDFAPVQIWEAERVRVADALERPGSKARNERGSLSISAFRRIAAQVWPLGRS